MGRTLTDGTTPGQTGCGLGMAHHYRTPGAKTKASPRVGGPPPSQARLGKTQLRDLHLRETIGLPKVNRMAQENAERQVKSKGTPHVGHADSVTNDEHGSWSDISD